ncbi:3-ketodihydrosphingosine reductase [Gracilaria domingensis]|nr:3-ketodihydrosphingosine reductase [Gracilaria domingensis]
MKSLSSLLDLGDSAVVGTIVLVILSGLFANMGILRNPFCNRSSFYKDKHVLITGGSSGIGKELARFMTEAGATVTLVARNKEKLRAAALDLEPEDPSNSASSRVYVHATDCSDNKSVQDMVSFVEEHYGPIDILVNCAGGAVGGYFEDLDPNVFRDQMNSNYFTQVFPTHAVFKRMAKRKSGHIVFVSSMAGQTPVFGQSAYAPTKYAVRGFAETMYYEAKPYNIGVTLVFPPDTDTPGLHHEKSSMPPETLQISETGGLFTAEHVAKSIADGVVRKRFRVCVGFIGHLLGILTAGVTPGLSVLDVLVIPIARAITPFFIWDHNNIVRKGHAKRISNGSEKEQ